MGGTEGENMEVTIDVMTLMEGLIIIEILGMILGFCIRDFIKFIFQKHKYKFIFTNKGMYRLNTSTGQVVLIKEKEKKIIFNGKKIGIWLNTFDLIKEDDEKIILYNFETGYCSLLEDSIND